MRKYAMARERLRAADIFDFVEAPFASTQAIELAHHPDYVRGFLAGTLDRGIVRRIGFPWSEGLVRRTLASVGGSLAAAADAIERGWGGNLAGGTHHAFPREGSGFCVFNDIAVVIRYLRAEGRIRRAAVIDLDVHQGDGTALIFQDDADVFTFSMHARNNFPFRKQQSRIDIGLPDGSRDEEYLRELESALPRAFEFAPGVVIYQSGVDGLACDSLGRLSLSIEGLCERDRQVFTACRQAGVPVLVTLGGGYSDPLDDTVLAHANTYLMAESILGGRGQ